MGVQLAAGIPAIILGVVTLFYPFGPSGARRFSRSEEKRWLQDKLASENAGMDKNSESGFKALVDPRVLLMALCYVAFPLAWPMASATGCRRS